MAFDGTESCWVPDVPIARNEEQRLRITQFGDGYAQRTLDGINALNQKWTVQFNNRERAVIEAMLAYFVARKGNSFQFKEPATKILYDVFCDSWSVEWAIRRKGPSPVDPIWYGTLSAEFVRAYGVTA